MKPEAVSEVNFPDPPVSTHPNSPANEPDWLRNITFPESQVKPEAYTKIRWKGKIEISLQGVFPPEQLKHISHQNASLMTSDKKMTRVFRVRNEIRIGSFTVDIMSWNENDFVYEANSHAKRTFLGPQGSLLRDADRNIVPIRLPFSGDGSVARLNRLKKREMDRR